MLAILPDIHANREALEAVLADARAHGASRYAAPGDIIGFGGDPVFCAERIRGLCAAAVRGNHEEALRNPSLFAAFPPVQRMTKRTHKRLPAPLLHWLVNLPLSDMDGGIPLTHATFHDPAHWGRLRHPAEAARSFAAQTAPLAFFGHTHRPTIFCMEATGTISLLPIRYDAEGSFCLPLKADCRYLVNPGSVGQPRDGDPRAAYALWDTAGSCLTLRRVAYDVEPAASGTLAMGLPQGFAEALRRGTSPL